MWDEIYSLTSMVQPLKFRNGQVISSHTLLGMWLLIHASKRGSWCIPISAPKGLILSMWDTGYHLQNHYRIFQYLGKTRKHIINHHEFINHKYFSKLVSHLERFQPLRFGKGPVIALMRKHFLNIAASIEWIQPGCESCNKPVMKIHI